MLDDNFPLESSPKFRSLEGQKRPRVRPTSFFAYDCLPTAFDLLALPIDHALALIPLGLSTFLSLLILGELPQGSLKFIGQLEVDLKE